MFSSMRIASLVVLFLAVAACGGGGEGSGGKAKRGGADSVAAVAKGRGDSLRWKLAP